ncbi:hypothetical protein GYMLUDRAFT_35280 [Collybiopsis luxurians FD-317 M1]|nr:hypothetical protein GYMLUDRAFT_35280 [Collybiopsis luxurians FD-317 M1]
MAPVLNLPPELLSEIFQLVGNALPPFVLSSVCSHWRAIVIETPSLWRKILLPDLSINQLQIHLQRSRSYPLSIHIYTPYVFDDCLLTLVAQHSERWEEAFLFMPVELYTSLSSIRGRIPLLKRLTFIALKPLQVVHFNGFEIAPALREVALRPLIARSTSKFPIPIVQLTKLRCNFYNTSFLCSYLARIPKLSHLYAHNYRSSHEAVTNSTLFSDVRFPELKTLELTLCQNSFIHFMLSRAPNLATLRINRFVLPNLPDSSSEIILPHLRHLILDHITHSVYRLHFSGFSDILKLLRVPMLSALELNDGDAKRDIVAVRDFIVRSGCQLDTFKLTINTDLAPETALLFQAMPSLEHLHIVVRSPKDVPFYLITPVSQVFPKLQTFDLSAMAWDAPDALRDLHAFAQSNGKLKVSCLLDGGAFRSEVRS